MTRSLSAPQRALIVCGFCGHRFPVRLGRYGCPNCHGEGLEVRRG